MSIGLVAIGTLVLSLFTGLTAAAQPTVDVTPIGSDSVCPPPGEDAVDAFADDDESTHESNIDCTAQYGIVEGLDDDTYGPTHDVTRAQMATFLVNEVETALGEELAEGDDAFTDDEGSVHETNINKLANAGMILGEGDDRYDPTQSVDRAQMATFVANAVDFHDDRDATNDSVLPTATSDYFVDDEGSTHEQSINSLADQGIVQGVDSNSYAPMNDVTRAQLATFLTHAAELAARLGYFEPVPLQPRSLNVELASLNDSGVTGNGTVTVNDDGTVTVSLDVEGVESGEVHPQHIHGFDDESQNAVCPTPDSRDQIADIPEEANDPDAFLGLEEGADEYGPVRLSLQQATNEGPFPRFGEFPRPDGTSYTYEQTFPAAELGSLPPLDQLENRAIVVHGMTVDSGEYVATLPVACGQLEVEPRTLSGTLTSLNDSGATGTATVEVNDQGAVTVSIDASGVEADSLHPQHIHGFDDAGQNAVCPNADSRDQLDGIPEQADDPDAFLGLEEGADEYGPVKLPLTAEDGEFPTSTGTTYTYVRTFDDEELGNLPPLDQLENRAIVLHGMTVDSGEYVGTLPVACGQLAATTN